MLKLFFAAPRLTALIVVVFSTVSVAAFFSSPSFSFFFVCSGWEIDDTFRAMIVTTFFFATLRHMIGLLKLMDIETNW